MSVERRRALHQRLGVEEDVEAAVDRARGPTRRAVPVPENTAAGTRSAAPLSGPASRMRFARAARLAGRIVEKRRQVDHRDRAARAAPPRPRTAGGDSGTGWIGPAGATSAIASSAIAYGAPPSWKYRRSTSAPAA